MEASFFAGIIVSVLIQFFKQAGSTKNYLTKIATLIMLAFFSFNAALIIFLFQEANLIKSFIEITFFAAGFWALVFKRAEDYWDDK